MDVEVGGVSEVRRSAFWIAAWQRHLHTYIALHTYFDTVRFPTAFCCLRVSFGRHNCAQCYADAHRLPWSQRFFSKSRSQDFRRDFRIDGT